MTASQPNLLELAKQGDATAIAALMNRHLQPKGVTATATLEDGCLQVALESQQVPNQPSLVEFIHKGVTNLGVDVIKQIRIYGVQTGKVTPVWEQDILLQPYASVPEVPSIEAPLPAAEEIVPSMPDIDPDLYGESALTVERKPGIGSFVKQNWKVIPMMVIAALVGFAAVVFILSRSQRSPQPVAESPTPAAASPATSPTTSPTASTSPTATPAAATPTPAAATPTSPASPTATASPVIPAPAATTSPAVPGVSPATSGTPFQQALQVGYSAAVNTQGATTQSQWDTVVSEWQQAIALLGSVPTTDANYATAQQKITEYQRNLSYAQRRLQEAATP